MIDLLNFTIVFKSLYQDEPLIVYAPFDEDDLVPVSEVKEREGMAKKEGVYIGISKRDDTEIHLYAEGIKQTHKVLLQEFCESKKGWPNGIIAVVAHLHEQKRIKGFNLYIDSSSELALCDTKQLMASAAASSKAINLLFNLELADHELSELIDRSLNLQL